MNLVLYSDSDEDSDHEACDDAVAESNDEIISVEQKPIDDQFNLGAKTRPNIQ